MNCVGKLNDFAIIIFRTSSKSSLRWALRKCEITWPTWPESGQDNSCQNSSLEGNLVSVSSMWYVLASSRCPKGVSLDHFDIGFTNQGSCCATCSLTFQCLAPIGSKIAQLLHVVRFYVHQWSKWLFGVILSEFHDCCNWIDYLGASRSVSRPSRFRFA